MGFWDRWTGSGLWAHVSGMRRGNSSYEGVCQCVLLSLSPCPGSVLMGSSLWLKGCMLGVHIQAVPLKRLVVVAVIKVVMAHFETIRETGKCFRNY